MENRARQAPDPDSPVADQRDTLAAENAANPNPRRIILRMDDGFGHAATLAWLYEQGYDFVVRGHNHRVPERLRLEGGLKWAKVSKNGFLAESKETTLGDSVLKSVGEIEKRGTVAEVLGMHGEAIIPAPCPPTLPSLFLSPTRAEEKVFLTSLSVEQPLVVLDLHACVA